jgi:hypothetical protein
MKMRIKMEVFVRLSEKGNLALKKKYLQKWADESQVKIKYQRISKYLYEIDISRNEKVIVLNNLS